MFSKKSKLGKSKEVTKPVEPAYFITENTKEMAEQLANIQEIGGLKAAVKAATKNYVGADLAFGNSNEDPQLYQERQDAWSAMIKAGKELEQCELRIASAGSNITQTATPSERQKTRALKRQEGRVFFDETAAEVNQAHATLICGSKGSANLGDTMSKSVKQKTSHAQTL